MHVVGAAVDDDVVVGPRLLLFGASIPPSANLSVSNERRV